MLSALAGFQFTANAQQLEWGHAMLGDSPAQIYATSIAVGPAGTVYSSGFITGLCNFDPGATDYSITENAPSPFVVKRDANGEFLWARTFSSGLETHFGNTVVDAAGNSYAFGLFWGTLDCDPGTGQHILTSGNSRKYFLIKLDTDGNFVWAREFGQLDSYVTVGRIAIQGNNLYCSAVYSGTAAFGDDELTTADVGSMFVTKISTDGTFDWTVGIGATDNTILAMEGTGGIAASASGDVFVTGFFSKAGDFDPGAGTTTLTPVGEGDAFILKLNNSGEFQWAVNSGGEHNEAGFGIALSPDGSVYQCGTHINNEDIPSPNEDLFVARYSATGTEIWLHQIGGPYMDQGLGIDVDEDGSVYVSGDFSSPSVDFDPGTGEHVMTANTNHGYILKLTASGDFVWAAPFKSPETNSLQPSSMWNIAYADGTLYGSGYFFGRLDMDAGVEESILFSDNDYASGFMLKLDTAEVVLGIDETASVSFGLYPNPTGETVNLQLEQLGSGSSLTVLNLQGERVLEQQLKALVTEIDLQHLPSGTYLVEIRQDGLKSNRRLVKM